MERRRLLLQQRRKPTQIVPDKLVIPIPQISILIPTYNRPIRLQNALRSIVEQTYQDYEVIVVNDGGKEIGDILSNFKFKNLTYISNKINKGLFSSLNIGLKSCRGKYVIELDDDDTFRPDTLKVLIKGFESEHIKVVFGKCSRFIAPDRHDIISLPNIDEINIWRLNWTTCNRMIERQALIDIGGFDESFKALGDWDVNIRLTLKYGIKSWKFVDEIIADINSSEDSMTKTKQDMFKKESEYIRNMKYYLRYKDKSLSIIIPTYYGHRYIRNAVISALECTEREHEVIVVNDGGDPAEERLIEDLPIQYHFLKENNGISGALNYAIGKSTKDFILWHGYDDELYKNKANHLLELFNDGIVMTYGDFDVIFEGYKEGCTCRKQEYHDKYFHKINGLGKFVMYPREVGEKIGIYDPCLKICLDLDYQIRLSRIGKAKHTKEIVGFSRLRKDSFSLANRELAELEIKKVRNAYSLDNR